MGYNEITQEKIASIQERVEEKTNLWGNITKAFDEEGSDGVSNDLKKQLLQFEKKVNTLLDKLKELL